jgi:hypothetical protein
MNDARRQITPSLGTMQHLQTQSYIFMIMVLYYGENAFQGHRIFRDSMHSSPKCSYILIQPVGHKRDFKAEISLVGMGERMVAKGWLSRRRHGSPPSYAVKRANSLPATRIGCAV